MCPGYQFGTLNREAKLGTINFTGNLVVDYRLPLPKNGTYLVRLWIEKVVDGRKGISCLATLQPVDFLPTVCTDASSGAISLSVCLSLSLSLSLSIYNVI